ncbi:MAG: hypothetical protein B7Z80_15955, partial [Rhodospirillales bacterium 20-64-7]
NTGIGSLTNNTSAFITGGLNGVSTGGNITGLTNSGTITGANGDGVYAVGGIANLDNTTIAALILGSKTGVYSGGSISSLSNNGSIIGSTLNGVNAGTIGTLTNTRLIQGNSYGVLSQTNIAVLSNTGSIIGTTNTGAQANGNIGSLSNGTGALISGAQTGVAANGSIGMLTNNGTIYGGTIGVVGGNIGTLVNTNMIEGLYTAIRSTGSIGTLTNSGTIIAIDPIAIIAAGSIGGIYNTNLISGSIIAGAGNLTITGGSGSTIGTLTGGVISATTGNISLGGNLLLADNASANGGLGTLTNTGNLQLNAPQTITGNFASSLGSTLILGVTAPGVGGQVDATGYINLADTAISLVPDGGTIATGQTYTIAGAQTATGTDYNGVVVRVSGLIVDSQRPTIAGVSELVVGVGPASYADLLTGGNQNAKSAGKVLDELYNLGTLTTPQIVLLADTQAQPFSAIPQFAKALDGEVHGANLAVMPEAGLALSDSVEGRLSEIDQNPQSAPLVWGNASVQLGSEKGDGYASGFSSTLSQFTVGMDLATMGIARVGVGFSHTDTYVNANIGKGTVDENAGFVYGQIPVGSFVVDGLASYGLSNTSSHRPDPTAPNTTLSTNNVGGNEALVSLGINMPLTMGGFAVSPYAREIFQDVTQNSSSEGNAVAALSTSSYSGSGERSMIGVQGGSAVTDPLATLFTYRFNLGAGVDTGNLLHPTMDASLAGLRTTITSPHVSPEFAQVSASATVRITSGAYSYARVSGEVRGGADQGSFTAGLRIAF